MLVYRRRRLAYVKPLSHRDRWLAFLIGFCGPIILATLIVGVVILFSF